MSTAHTGSSASRPRRVARAARRGARRLPSHLRDLAGAGVIAVQGWGDRSSLEPFGQVGSFGGRLVHWREREGEPPTIVLMSGCGLAMEFWRYVVRMLPDGHLVAYDRPGLGGTPWPGHLPTLAEELETLRDLVQSRGSSAILVAHSMASFHAEALARLHPELVRAAVMVDGSVEWLARPPHRASSAPARLVAHAVNAFRLGGVAALVWRWGTWFQSHRDYQHLGYGRIPTIYRDADSLAMGTAESFAYNEQAWDLMKVRDGHPYPPVPTIVLTADDGSEACDSQQRWARMLGAEWLLVHDSKHLMMLDQPGAIVEAVHQVTARSALDGDGPREGDAGSVRGIG